MNFPIAYFTFFGQKFLLYIVEAGRILPPSASATNVDKLFFFILAITGFFFFLIVGLMLIFLILYRHRLGVEAKEAPKHNLPLELTWTVIPLVLVFVIFLAGFKGYMDMAIAPLETYEINVTGQRWNWLFTYPNGYIDKELHVPTNQAVTLVITSEDVIHSLFIPALRLKRDAVPGRYSKLWFKVTVPGEYPIYCAEYCGTGHSTMLTKMVVHEAGEYEKWLEKSSSYILTLSPVEAGKKLFETRGCMQCHSVDGSRKIGPTFKDFFGESVTLRDGKKVIAEENYVRESITEPLAKVVGGFDPVMPTYKGRLKDAEISAIIAYLKSLSKKGRANLELEKAREKEEETKGDSSQTSQEGNATQEKKI